MTVNVGAMKLKGSSSKQTEDPEEKTCLIFFRRSREVYQ